MLAQTQTIKQKICPKCGHKLEYNLSYGTDDCTNCSYTEGNSD